MVGVPTLPDEATEKESMVQSPVLCPGQKPLCKVSLQVFENALTGLFKFFYFSTPKSIFVI
jgi:hypothetical protein